MLKSLFSQDCFGKYEETSWSNFRKKEKVKFICSNTDNYRRPTGVLVLNTLNQSFLLSLDVSLLSFNVHKSSYITLDLYCYLVVGL